MELAVRVQVGELPEGLFLELDRAASPAGGGDMPEGTLRAIPKQAGIEPGNFLKA